ncbi:SUF system NifU family Fe-S cluster assembly protein [Candidatus Woesearchaeota archaeon]|nr:SUF system NifU family Fe-S cluster assembly protein [Candidatus Woesearchaeota archaeon]
MEPSYAGEGIYRENILDHYKHPHNKGIIENADIKFTENNPFCGDVITVTIKLKNHKTDGMKLIDDIKFTGSGCAISQAAASMLTEKIKGKSLKQIKNIQRDNIVNMLGIKIGVVRTKCAMLCLTAIKEGIKKI